VPALVAIACSDTTASSDLTKLTFLNTAAGAEHSCARTTTGTAYCWGNNVAGQIGARTDTDESRVPLLLVLRPLELAAVSAGTMFSCGLLSTGVPLCWGNDDSSPRRIMDDGVYSSLSVGTFGCGVREEGATLCWDDPDAEPYVIDGPEFTSVSVGGSACALAVDGSAWCWPRETRTAQLVPGGLTFTAVTVGSGHACGIAADATAHCWGENQRGQLGNLSSAAATAPDTVSGGHLWSQLSAGTVHTCGVTTAGGAYCWGEAGSGRLGYNGPPPAGSFFNVPVRVRGGALPATAEWTSIAAGGAHTCGTIHEGRAFCWGENSHGQLGNGTTEDAVAPVSIGADGPASDL
jgi:alpha-tubulin suppressor-like RCC1 family protein